MGIRKMDWNEWIEMDSNFIPYHDAKVRELEKDTKSRVQYVDNEVTRLACFEVLEELTQYLTHRYPDVFQLNGSILRNTVTRESFPYPAPNPTEAMVTAAKLVQDDLVIMVLNDDGQYHIDAGAVCLPGFWRLTEKYRMSLDELHIEAGVPHYQEKLQKAMNRFFANMTCEKPVIRNNFFIQLDDGLAWSHRMGDQNSNAVASWATANAQGLRVEDIHFRSERQSLRRLPKSKALLFTIRTYFEPVTTIAKEPHMPGRLAEAIRNWDETSTSTCDPATMVLGFERINERTQRPNAHINFIRTLPGPTSPTAENILNRVAAICYPFMKSHMILVQALEEFPYNTEFVGRNFNAGEVIQLVLRDSSGRWLPQRMVEMVMVHELAHCKQMNHSKAFWKVRDAYAVDLRALWARGYVGEGLWGRGRELDTGALQASESDHVDVPEHLCGGTYGRRGGKRKRGGKEKPTLSYAERKQRRIMKKFGAGGQSLGADDDTKVKLEKGVPKKGKPRVAGSARGRDLRAAAALARFNTAKKEDGPVIKKEEPLSDSETDDEFVEGDQLGAAVDVDGKSMFDDKGRALIKICEEDDDDDKHGNAKRELSEIQGFAAKSLPPTSKSKPPSPAQKKKSVKTTNSASNTTKQPAPASHKPPSTPRIPSLLSSHASSKPSTCPICSLENDATALTCSACAHVLKRDFVPEHWSCC
ncbi:wlm domain-containing protein [Stemphylium lycopersici]|uniref:WLM-domain-containing protein n=1 Tax=Stemphylium lycopersici TaxID=183478 RepID=A0A364MW47_STELY|nr:wlm domain-containing protein [Stemphylium lycopersici]RAR05349.1 WLM-domain-containing protein [Stemphylium lycopersici]